ncbi:hypothetical protein [Thalassobellus sediminis]|uniref:hypothetical protein n=1 Tax=Thalassobellus sediminis TaxID=3367753 RepID=UPI0037AE9811
MKKLALIIILLLVSISIEAQTPEKLSYQAIIRNSSDEILANQPIGIQISILQSSASGTAVYTETQNPSTNANGLISIEIGNGTSSDDFTTIDWSANTYFIKTEIDPTGGSAYNITSTSQLMSVPYALYAKTSGSSTPGPKGDKGDKGDQGDTGAQGLKGDKGDQGDTGEQGLKGDKGDKGDTGATGPKGDKGDTGADGNDVTELPTGGTDGQVLKTNGSGTYTWTNQTTDTQLTETQVDNYVSDNGYLTSVTESNISGTIAINKITNLQTALDAKQANIGDGDLTIARTSGLQTALDSKQDAIADGDLTIAKTDGLQTALDAKLETETQNLEDVLTESNDANEKSIVNVNQIAVGTDTPNASAAVDISSTTGALLLPRLNETERDNLTAVPGMVIYNTDTNKFQGYRAATGNGVDQSQETQNDDRLMDDSSQSFTAGFSGALTQVDVYLEESFLADNNITFTLRDGAGTSGTILFTQAMPTVSGNYTWYSVTISGVTLVAGNQYTISCISSNGPDSARWGRDSSDTYSGGDAYYNGAAQSSDFCFRTYNANNIHDWTDLH